MLITKHIPGHIHQVYDTNKQQFVSQEFKFCGPVSYSVDFDKSMTLAEFLNEVKEGGPEPYLDIKLTQPGSPESIAY